MNVLLDTHIYLWVLEDSARLTREAREFLQQATSIYVSAASIWEVAVKSAVGKLRADAAEVARHITVCGFQELPVRSAHAAQAGNLPLHHKDPFDRMLIAQAMHEPLVLITADAILLKYSDLVRLI